MDKLTERHYSESAKSNIFLEITSVKEFKDLIEQAKEQIYQLEETIDKLQDFDIKFEFALKAE
ncbi:hypothetical protein ITJ11_018585 (plasmid) [Clostridioides difficile]|uniref:hypothetical protein n=1 Tax=Clostridioides difficile TaxID=1496 RepID=UPI00093CCD5E|nr:hypothetical protein [Clostridioides difficile]EII6834384.1 hypothetical protein [Clostridioides difficile]EIJ0739937.1 hypothetical protein [Clostridioides difficile]EJX3465906.1 hypothetical protein [Clostridioides difficile]EKS6825670.1 hypothetical protein [Clostridioides difficile]MBF4702337.1 hypothetical protein [Clostridioides difficile]